MVSITTKGRGVFDVRQEGRSLNQGVGILDTYFPEGDKTSSFTIYGYVIAQTIVQVLKQCGDELTREHVMRQAANLKDFETWAFVAAHQDQHKLKRLFPR
jgi:hypothetical protein